MIDSYTKICWKENSLISFVLQCFTKGRIFFIYKFLFICAFFIKQFWFESFILFFLTIIDRLRPVFGIKLYKAKKRQYHKTTAIPYFTSYLLRNKKGIRWLALSIKEETKEIKFVYKILSEFYSTFFCKWSLALKKKREYYSNGVVFRIIKKYKW